MKNEINLTITLPDPYYEIWQGVKAIDGIDEGYLNDVTSRIVTEVLKNIVGHMDFGA